MEKKEYVFNRRDFCKSHGLFIHKLLIFTIIFRPTGLLVICNQFLLHKKTKIFILFDWLSLRISTELYHIQNELWSSDGNCDDANFIQNRFSSLDTFIPFASFSIQVNVDREANEISFFSQNFHFCFGFSICNEFFLFIVEVNERVNATSFVLILNRENFISFASFSSNRRREKK